MLFVVILLSEKILILSSRLSFSRSLPLFSEIDKAIHKKLQRLGLIRSKQLRCDIWYICICYLGNLSNLVFN